MITCAKQMGVIRRSFDGMKEKKIRKFLQFDGELNLITNIFENRYIKPEFLLFIFI